ncbi:sperm flagellar protein 1-like [Athalia rosae]|uniref:sperm flagellar protein 1-like n=1 Tax=Athalia rosae TaxID=37344 RepID=UPI0020347D75|nr:sperm flagellar protein 1-like [Athalia rosae]
MEKIESELKMNELSSCMDNVMAIYAWIDEIPFSRPKKNLSRDFSDGVLMAEVLRLYFPRLVNVHNYIPASNVASKIENWNTLNRRILSKIDMKLGKEVINQLANAQQGVIEKVLMDLRRKIIAKDSNDSNNSLDGSIRKFIPNTESRTSQNCETEKTSSSQKTGIVKSNDDKNLPGKAHGWFPGWMWPFGSHSKSSLNQGSSPGTQFPFYPISV